MKYKLYTTSQKAWDGMFKAIKAAQESIYLEMFIFLDDTGSTHDFFNLLENKAKSGVEVIIIADAYGSFFLKAKSIKDLRRAGIEFISFNYWLRRTHRKILIIDRKIAFLGGVNIKNEIRYWHDLQIKLEGKIIKPILKSFAKAYYRGGGNKESILKLIKIPLSKKIKAWIIDNWPSTSKRYYLNNYYRQKIDNAQKLIQIVTPYLLPPSWLITALNNACQRGVKIEIIIPSHTDIKALDKINYLNSSRLTALGVDFYFMPKMNHAKLLLIDDKEGLIGSQNMDILSFGVNKEVGVFFNQKTLVHDLKIIIEKWKSEATLFKAEYKKMKWHNKVLVGIFKIFYPLL